MDPVIQNSECLLRHLPLWATYSGLVHELFASWDSLVSDWLLTILSEELTTSAALSTGDLFPGSMQSQRLTAGGISEEDPMTLISIRIHWSGPKISCKLSRKLALQIHVHFLGTIQSYLCRFSITPHDGPPYQKKLLGSRRLPCGRTKRFRRDRFAGPMDKWYKGGSVWPAWVFDNVKGSQRKTDRPIGFYLILNVAVGGTNGWFPDGPEKPWLDGSSSEYLVLDSQFFCWSVVSPLEPGLVFFEFNDWRIVVPPRSLPPRYP